MQNFIILKSNMNSNPSRESHKQHIPCTIKNPTEHDHLFMFVLGQIAVQFEKISPTNFTASDRNGLKQYFPNCSLRTKYYVKIKIYCTKNHILSNLGNNLIVLCIISTVNI